METTFFISQKNLNDFLMAASKMESDVEVILTDQKIDTSSPILLKVKVIYKYPFSLFYLGIQYCLNIKK